VSRKHVGTQLLLLAVLDNIIPSRLVNWHTRSAGWCWGNGQVEVYSADDDLHSRMHAYAPPPVLPLLCRWACLASGGCLWSSASA
jgi:hypothetical protein